MRRRQFIATAGAGTALAASGCLSSLQLGGSSDPVGAADFGDPNTAGVSTIEVSGTGEAEADPEIARLQVSVEASGSSAEEVRAELAERAPEVEGALVDAGVDEDDITTSRFRIRDPSRTAGFEGEHRFAVTIRDIDEVGTVIDSAVDGGADDIGRVNFTLTEETRDERREEALHRAIEDARAEAEVIADAKNVEIVGAVKVATTDTRMSPFRTMSVEVADDGAAAPPTDIQEGPVTVTAQVEVIYAIE